MDLKQELKKHFPFEEFIGQQERVLDLVLNQRKDVLALMATGAGKSLCFQFPSKVRPGLVLVISPLIALMRDQVQASLKLNIHVACLNSLQTSEEKKSILKQLAEGKLQLLYVTPERFRKTEFWEALGSQKLSLLAVDEAHCISQWGHDFRPDYSKLGMIRERLGNPQTLALTATATMEVQDDICRSLKMEQAERVLGGVERSNLQLHVLEVQGFRVIVMELKRLLEINHAGARIVYFSLIKTLRAVEAELCRSKISCLVYHGDLPAQKRKNQQRLFIEEQNPLILATPAFGLGIDKKNVRSVIHFELPGSLEDYYQEIGRAGRDGLISKTYLLYDPDDILIQMDFMKWAHPEQNYIEKLCQLLRDHETQFAQEGPDFLREQMSFKNRQDFRVEASLQILERWGCLAKDGDQFSFVRMPTQGDWVGDDLVARHKHQQKKLLRLVEWIKLEDECRLRNIYSYFGDASDEDCGMCDVCTGAVQNSEGEEDE